MSNRSFFIGAAVLGLLIGAAIFGVQNYTRNAGGLPSLVNGPYSYHQGIQRAAPAVVSVFSTETLPGHLSGLAESRIPANRQPSRPDQIRTNQGSGVIINEQGHVLTNHHLIAQADQLHVTLSDGRLFEAKLMGADPETDLAVLKIATGEPLPYCSLAADHEPRVGDIVLAIGNPFGVGQTVTQGIVSAVNRQVDGAILQRFVQIDAAINPGNSGGALITPAGDLVGINTAVFSNARGAVGIGFAIPASLVQDVVDEILANGRIRRGWLGIAADSVHRYPTLYALTTRGAVISTIFADSPAHKAGLQTGDVVTAVGTAGITNARHLVELVTDRDPGEVLKLSGIRVTEQGVTNWDTEVLLAERPQINVE